MRLFTEETGGGTAAESGRLVAVAVAVDGLTTDCVVRGELTGQGDGCEGSETCAWQLHTTTETETERGRERESSRESARGRERATEQQTETAVTGGC